MNWWLEVGQLIFWAVTIVFGLITARKGIRELRLSTESRDREIRWKAASTARELITEIHHNFYASNAVLMLDWWGSTRRYPAKRDNMMLISDGANDGLIEITPAEIRSALAQPRAPQMEAKAIFVRDCFDWFFFYVDRIEQYVRTGLIQAEDAHPVFVSYVKVIAGEPETFRRFIEDHEYRGALRFFKLADASVPVE
jgi:hypothetical protein